MNMNMNPNLDYIKPKGLPNNTHSKNSPLSLGKPGNPGIFGIFGSSPHKLRFNPSQIDTNKVMG